MLESGWREGLRQEIMRPMTDHSWNSEVLRARLQTYPPYAGAGVLFGIFRSRYWARVIPEKDAGCDGRRSHGALADISPFLDPGSVITSSIESCGRLRFCVPSSIKNMVHIVPILRTKPLHRFRLQWATGSFPSFMRTWRRSMASADVQSPMGIGCWLRR